jgi:hypothetical protein
MKDRKKVDAFNMSLYEGWDARAWDKNLHYFVKNRAICNIMFRYKPPYFYAGVIPEPDEMDDYCNKCVQLLRYRIKYVNVKRFII